ncbi:MAG: hypothetical protein NT026_03150 [Candidatus Staskawiczbacteria bacterium]|nr:hypothetical protein [Candidatus Staskawiczbacteria bacterium]
MAEQQLINYIKDAKKAGQSDEQSRSLLYKNGWTETEVREAFAALEQSQQPQPQSQSQPQAQPQSQYQPKPQPSTQPQQAVQPSPATVQVQYKPQAQPQPQLQPAQNLSKARKPSHSPLVPILIVFIFVILLALGGGAYVLYSHIYDPSWNPFGSRPDPAQVLSSMFEKMGEVKLYTTKTTMQFSVKDTAGADQGKMSLSITSKGDTTDPNNPKTDMSITGSLADSASGSQIFSFDANLVVIGNTLYLKINNLTSAASLLMDLSKVQGKWLALDEKSLADISSAVGTPIGQIDQTPILNQAPQSLDSLKNLVSVEKQLADQEISGQNTYHYLLKVSNQSLKSAVDKIMSSEIVDSFIEKLGDINIDAWIGKNDYLLYQYKINKALNLEDFFPGAGIQINLALDSVASDFNKPVSIAAPESSEKAETVILPLIKRGIIAADMEQIAAEAEAVFSQKNSYATLCVGHALDVKQTNLADLVKDIIAQGALKPGCFVSSTSYCVSTQLADRSFMCVGLGSGVGSAKCTSPTTVCK